MTVNQVYEYFGKNWANAMRGLGLSKNAYQRWLKVGYIPLVTQNKIAKITKNKLKSSVE